MTPFDRMPGLYGAVLRSNYCALVELGFLPVEAALGLANNRIPDVPADVLARRRQEREGWREIHPERA